MNLWLVQLSCAALSAIYHKGSLDATVFRTASVSARAQDSDDVLNYFPPQEAAMIREEAELCEMSVNAMLADFAKLGYKTAMDEFAKTNPIPTNILGRKA